MKTPLFDRARFQARIAGYSISLLLGVAAFVYTEFASAADPKQGTGGEHQVTQIVADGPVVLRGTRPPSQPAPARRSNGSGSTVIVTPWFVAPNTGFDTTLDRSGLSPPGGIMGPYWGD
jgi:hypothetical protein